MITHTFHTVSQGRVDRCCHALRTGKVITCGWATPGGYMRVRGTIRTVTRSGESLGQPMWDITIEGERVYDRADASRTSGAP